MSAIRNEPAARSPIAVDIGASQLRAMQVARALEGWQITEAAAVDLDAPPDLACQKGRAALGAQLGRLISTHSFRGRRAVAVMPHALVEMHALRLPGADAADLSELRGAARVELQRYESMNLQTASVELWPTDAQGSGARGNVMAAAASHQAVDTVLDLLGRAGLVAEKIDVAPCALLPTCWPAARPSPTTVWAVLDIGWDAARVIVCRDDTPALVRSVPVGGQQLTDAIARGLNLAHDDAESVKCEHGIARATRERRCTDAPPGSGTGRDVARVIYGLTRDALEQLAAEVERSVFCVLNDNPGTEAGFVILAGGGGQLKQLPEYLQEKLGVPVQVAVPPGIAADNKLPFAVCQYGFARFAAVFGLAAHEEAAA